MNIILIRRDTEFVDCRGENDVVDWGDSPYMLKFIQGTVFECTGIY